MKKSVICVTILVLASALQEHIQASQEPQSPCSPTIALAQALFFGIPDTETIETVQEALAAGDQQASTLLLNAQPTPSRPKTSIERAADGKFHCTHDQCTYATKDRYTFAQHQMTHTGEKPHVCTHPGCNQAFTRKHHLQDHQSTHTGEKTYVCGIGGCTHACIQKSNLKTHQRFIHKNSVPSTQQDDRTSRQTVTSILAQRLKSPLLLREADGLFHCSNEICGIAGCNQAFALKSHLQNHQRRRHMSNPVSQENQALILAGTSQEHIQASQEPQLPRSPTIPLSQALFFGIPDTETIETVQETLAAGDQQASTLLLNAQPTPSRPKTSIERAADGKFHCTHDQCTYATKDRSNFIKHQLKHTGEKPYACTHPGCEEAFAYRHVLKRHQSTHTGEKNFVCGMSECSQYFADKSALKKHQKRRHVNHQVSQENQPILADAPQEHMQAPQEPQSPTSALVHALLCNTEDIETVQETQATGDQQADDMPDTNLNALTTGKLLLDEHTSRQTVTSILAQCLTSPLLLREADGLFHCSNEICGIAGCNQAFALKSHLQNHQRRRHMSNPVSRQNQALILAGTSQEHIQASQEPQLPRSPTIPLSQALAYDTAAPETVQETDVEGAQQVGEFSPNTPPTSSDGLFHGDQDQHADAPKPRQTITSILAQRLKSPLRLRGDYSSRTETSIEKAADGKFHCTQDQCSYATPNRSHFAQHQLTHTGDKTYVCGIDGCNKAFALQRNLNAHQRSIHRGERPHPCGFPGCEQAFTTKSHLQDHQTTHTSEKAYVCGMGGCNKAFAKKNNLTRHQSTHTGEKTVCGMEGCIQAFTDKSTLKRHQKRRHVNHQVSQENQR